MEVYPLEIDHCESAMSNAFLKIHTIDFKNFGQTKTFLSIKIWRFSDFSIFNLLFDKELCLVELWNLVSTCIYIYNIATLYYN